MKLLVLLVLIGLLAGLIYLIKMLPWWGGVLLVLGGIVFGIWFIKWLLVRLFTAPFKMKSAVLKGASVVVHGIVPASAPELAKPGDADGEADESDDERKTDFAKRAWYHLEATVTPAERQGAFRHWEPGELLLVHPDKKTDFDSESASEDEDHLCVIHDLDIFQDGAFVNDEGMKFEGPVRLKLHIGVMPGTPRLKFQYYFESLSEVAIPK
ncbi:MAG: hypothetical protein AMXMBFR7_46420 [Planctomycetota bacterium]